MIRSAPRIVAVGCAALLLGAVSATAAERGTTTDGRAYVSGGIGVEERIELERTRPQFSLRVVTAARGSGAFLADARIRIAGAGGRQVLDTAMSGPILLVDLLPGRYLLDATANGQTKQIQTAITDRGGREVYFYFDVPVEVLPQDAPERR